MTANRGTWFGHPRGLFVLFMTEMWERFSFYGMRALLILYMTKYLLLDGEKVNSIVGFQFFREILTTFFGPMSTQAISSQIYGLYTGFVYFTPLIGGAISDKYLGQRRAVYLGGVLFAIGHFMMASEELFLIALFFLTLGNGFFKPNISSQVGNLYSANDPKKDGGFTIFYMGINIGAFFSPLVCGTLGQRVGWHYGFAAAGVGMLVSLMIYHFGQKSLPPDRIMQRKQAVTLDNLTPTDWKRIVALVGICTLTIVFWAIYEQQGNTLQLFADEKIDWHLFGVEIPSSWYQSLNPFIIFLFAPLLDRMWAYQDKKKCGQGSITKMALACFMIAAAFVIMIFAAKATEGGNKGNLMWLVTTTFVFTVAELYLSPIGLSLTSKIAPAKVISLMMGTWFLSSFFGNILSGYIGMFYEVVGKDQFFLLLTALGVGSGFVFLLFRRPLLKLIGSEV